MTVLFTCRAEAIDICFSFGSKSKAKEVDRKEKSPLSLRMRAKP